MACASAFTAHKHVNLAGITGFIYSRESFWEDLVEREKKEKVNIVRERNKQWDQ